MTGSPGNFDPFGPATVTASDLVLRWKRLVTTQSIMPDCLKDTRIDVELDHYIGAMVMRTRSYVLGEELPPHTATATGYAHFEAPASWWQHLKYQHGHRWWLRPLARRRPARMTGETRSVTLTATWENMAAYPWAELATIAPYAQLGSPVRLTWLTSSMDWKAETP